MKTRLSVVALLAGAAQFAAAGDTDAQGQATAHATIVNPNGERIGDAVFEQAPSGVIINVRVAGLAPGPKGLHLHSVGACAPDFAAAKGHINPDGRRHGLRNDSPDNGDLPNLHVRADGSAAAEFFHQRVRVSPGDATPNAPPLLDGDGSAIVIHAAPDDHKTQPIGGAGGRIGCGVIVETAAPRAGRQETD